MDILANEQQLETEIIQNPKPEHIEMLMANPESADQFDEIYGDGASLKYLPVEKKVEKVETKEEPVQERGVTEDVIKSGLAGFFKEGSRETLETIQGLSNWLKEKVPQLNFTIRRDEDGIHIVSPEEMREEKITEGKDPDKFEGGLFQDIADVIPETQESSTTAGQITKGFAQFGAGLLGAKKITNSIKGYNKLNKYVKASIDGGIADFLVFDEHEARFTDLIIDLVPEAEDTWLNYLSADETDTFWEGKLKNVLEGVMLGSVVDGTLRFGKYLKDLRKAKKLNNLSEADKIAKKRSKEILDEFDNISEEELAYLSKVNRGIPFELKVKAGRPSRVKVQETVKSSDYIKTVKDNIKRVRAGDLEFDEAFDIPLNFEKLGKSKKLEVNDLSDVVAVTKAIYDNVESIADKMGHVKTFDDVLKESDEFIQDPIDTLVKANRLNKDLEKGDSLRTALRIVYKGLVRQYINTAKKLDSGLIDQREVDNIFDLTSKHLELIKNIGKGGARIINAGNIFIKQEAPAIKEATKLIEKSRFKLSPEDLKKLHKKVANADVQTATRTLKDILTLKRFGINQLNEYWINAILSNPKTHMVNMTSNLLTSLIRPIEQMIGSGFGLRDRQGMIEAMSTASGLFKYFSDSLQASRVAFRKGDSLLDKNLNKVDLPEQAIRGKLGKGIRMPTRFLQAEDEFFKQINYRSKVYGMAVGDGIAKGLSRKKTIKLPNGKKVSELDEFVEEQMANSINPKSGEGLNKIALKYAQENTFTKELGAKTLGGKVQQTVNAVPILRFVAMPFVRTPVNLMRFVWDRSPISMFRKEFMDELADPITRSSALGKIWLGNSLFLASGVLAWNGIITGGYAKEKHLRRQQMDSGFQPYSFHLGEKYYSYERFDPYGNFFGLLADMFQVSSEATEEDRQLMAEANKMALFKQMATVENAVQISSGTGMGIINNLTNKTYLKGLADLIGVLESGEPRKLERWLKQKGGSMVPSFLTNITNDPLYREARTIHDTIKTKTWAFGDVDPSYNALGEKRFRDKNFLERFLLPTSVSENKGDIVMNEFVRLNQAIEPIQQKMGVNNNVDLAQFKNEDGETAWKRWNELTGTIKLGGKTLRERLEKDIQNTKKWDRLTDNPVSEDFSYTGSKKDYINRIVRMYRMKARKQLFKEGFVSENGMDLKKSFINDKRNSGLSKKGRDLLPLE